VNYRRHRVIRNASAISASHKFRKPGVALAAALPGVKSSFRWCLFCLILLLTLPCFGQTSVQLVCDSIAASKTKCGFTAFVGSKRFLNRFQSFGSEGLGKCGASGTQEDSYTLDANYNCNYSLDSSSCTEQECDLTPPQYYCESGCIQCPMGDAYGESLINIRNQGCLDPFGNCDWCCGPFYPSVTETTSVLDATYTNGAFSGPAHGTEHLFRSITLSNEYTTAMLKSNTVAALPPYPGTFSGTCSAYRNLSSDKTSYAIRRLKYKFTFPAAVQPFTIHWVERFTPDDGGPPTDTSKSELIPVGATTSTVRKVLEPSSNGTITIECVGTLKVETASIRNGQFVITVPAVDCSTAAGTLDLILKQQNSSTNQIVLKTFQNQQPGTLTVRLDDIMNVDTSTPLDGQDGIVFDRAAVRWRVGAVDETSPDQNLDVPVEVLSQRRISNYFSPTWGGSWLGAHLTKGVYPGIPYQFPSGLYNVDRQTDFLNALDPSTEGLAMDGNTVIRLHEQPVQPGFPPVEFLPQGSGRYGYIEFPDRRQSNTASASTVRFLRDTSVAVRSNADRLSYRTADEVYVPGFGVRTVDDAGGRLTIKQIDIWIGQGDSAFQAEANEFGIRFRTCLKILNQ
jgi:3D (Asp-Asp-Asp) domain-containing protein